MPADLLLDIETSIRRAREDTAAFGADLCSLPAVSVPPPSKAQLAFDHFDLRADRLGALRYEEVLLGLRAHGMDVEEDTVREMFDELDMEGTGVIERSGFAGLLERISVLRQGRVWPRDTARLAVAARALHAQALRDPLALVAEGEIPTLLRCALCGHASVEQLALSALAVVAEAPQAQCAQAIAARPALADVLASLGRPSTPLPIVRQGARLLAALCQDAAEAKQVGPRRKVRLQLYELVGPLLHGRFGRDCIADEAQAAPSAAHLLCALASEPELVPRLGSDGGGGAVRLACDLARSSSASARAAAIGAIAAIAAVEGDTRWKLVGFGALEALVTAAAAPGIATEHAGELADVAARRALGLLQYEALWKGVRTADPLAERPLALSN